MCRLVSRGRHCGGACTGSPSAARTGWWLSRRRQVATAADPPGVLVAVALHQGAYGVLEAAVMQRVELRQSVTQDLRPHRLPPGLLLPVVKPVGPAKTVRARTATRTHQ